MCEVVSQSSLAWSLDLVLTRAIQLREEDTVPRPDVIGSESTVVLAEQIGEDHKQSIAFVIQAQSQARVRAQLLVSED